MRIERLDGKIALVTGASSGIGEATAIALAELGADVALAARRVDRLEGLRARIEALGPRALVVPTDITDAAQVEAMVATTVAQLGRLDILVNNAGVMQNAMIGEAQLEEWRRMIDTNVWGLMVATKAAFAVMVAQNVGHIVNVSSVSGRQAAAGASGYHASEWALGGFSEALRQEGRPHNVRVTLIEPGMVVTELQSHATNDFARERTRRMLEGIVPLQAEDVAECIAFCTTRPVHVAINELLLRASLQG